MPGNEKSTSSSKTQIGIWTITITAFLCLAGLTIAIVVDTFWGIPNNKSGQIATEKTDIVQLGTNEVVSKVDVSKKETTPSIRRLAKLKAVKLAADPNWIHPMDREWVTQTLRELVLAADEMDKIFFKQVYRGNSEVVVEMLKAGLGYPAEEMHLFRIMHGPWDRLDGNTPFFGTKKKPIGAGFYPEDMTKEEFETWVAKHPDKKEDFESYFTVIGRRPVCRRVRDCANDLSSKLELVAIPYSEYYQEELHTAGTRLRMAANFAKEPQLANFLKLRADAFSTDDYFASDMAWMDLGNSPIEIIIGPYETYEDELFGYKAAFEAIIGIRDLEGTAQLQKFIGYLPEWRDHLPVDAKYKIFPIKESPLTVVNEVYAGGEAAKVPVAIALQLPNDPRVWAAKGTKKVLFKNIMEAKFTHCMTPIAGRVLSEVDAATVTFDVYWNFILGHEMAHGLVPSEIEIGKRTVADDAGNYITVTDKTTIAKALQDRYAPIEEARADLTSVYNMQYLIDTGKMPKDWEEAIYNVLLAGVFRSARFGEAHATANILYFNYLRLNGAFRYEPYTRHYLVDFKTIKAELRKCLTMLYNVELTGNYERAGEILATYGKISPEMQNVIDGISDIPIDILPQFDLTPILGEHQESHGSIIMLSGKVGGI